MVPCDPALADTAAFCAAYGYGLDQSANAIVVVGKGDPRMYAALRRARDDTTRREQRGAQAVRA